MKATRNGGGRGTMPPLRNAAVRLCAAGALAAALALAGCGSGLIDNGSGAGSSGLTGSGGGSENAANADIGTETSVDPFSGTTWLTDNSGNFYFSTDKTIKWGSEYSAIPYAYRVTYNGGSYIANIYTAGSSRTWEWRLIISSYDATLAERQSLSLDGSSIFSEFDTYCTKDTPDAYAEFIGTETSSNPFLGTTWQRNDKTFYFSSGTTVKRDENFSYVYRVRYSNGAYIATMYLDNSLAGTGGWWYRLIISSAGANTAVYQTHTYAGYAITHIGTYAKQERD